MAGIPGGRDPTPACLQHPVETPQLSDCSYHQTKKEPFIHTCPGRRDGFGNEGPYIQERFLWVGVGSGFPFQGTGDRKKLMDYNVTVLKCIMS